MLRLYLEGSEVELTEDVEFTINKYFEDTYKPTNRYIEFSKTVSVPFTQANNALFGHIYEPDRVTQYDRSQPYTGLHFDPYRKITMRLEDGSNILLRGYAKLLSVDWDGTRGVYNLNLYGELGKVFGVLQKLTFDNTDGSSDYGIDGGGYYTEFVNRQTIYDSWNNEQSTMALKRRNTTGYHHYDIVGWTPLNYKTDSKVLDQKSYEYNGQTLQFQSLLDAFTEPTFTEATHCSAETAIGDGLSPRGIGEFRSYLQQPYIYFNKLLQIVGVKCKSLTGYEFELDADWFSDSNPYYKDVVVALKHYEQQDDSVTNYYGMECSMEWTGSYTTPKTVAPTLSVQSEEVSLLSGQKFNVNNFDKIAGNNMLNIYIRGKDSRGQYVSFYDMSSNNALILDFIMQGSGVVKKVQTFILCGANSSVKSTLQAAYPAAIIVQSNGNWVSKRDEIVFAVNENDVAYGNMGVVQWSMHAFWYQAGTPLLTSTTGSSSVSSVILSTSSSVSSSVSQNFALKVYSKSCRSYCKMTLNDLWNKDVLPWTIVMQYCKMFRIGIFVGDDKVIFKPYTHYFKDYTVEDWSDKLDKSADYSIQPMTYEHKYIMFGYADSDTANNEMYKAKYGVNFGEKRITTNYMFGDDTEQLFDDVQCPQEVTDSVLSWTDLYDNKRIAYTISNETYVNCKDSDGALVDNFGTFYLDKGVQSFDTNNHLRGVMITDDTGKQVCTGTYTYNQFNDYIQTTRYHAIGIVKNGVMMTYTTPMESYSVENYARNKGLFELFWANYLSERYDSNNKIVTCRLALTPTDIAGFAFNKFVTIGNQLYFVNKIKDYRPNTDDTTECELITVQSIEGYTSNNYDTEFSVSPSSLQLAYKGGSTTFEVTSNRAISVRAEGTNAAIIDGSYIYNASKYIESGMHTLSGTFSQDKSGFTLLFSGGGKTQSVAVSLVSTETLTATLTPTTINTGGSGTLTLNGLCNYTVRVSSADVSADLTKITLSSTSGALNNASARIAVNVASGALSTNYTLTITTDGTYGERLTRTVTFAVQGVTDMITVTDNCGNSYIDGDMLPMYIGANFINIASASGSAMEWSADSEFVEIDTMAIVSGSTPKITIADGLSAGDVVNFTLTTGAVSISLSMEIREPIFALYDSDGNTVDDGYDFTQYGNTCNTLYIQSSYAVLMTYTMTGASGEGSMTYYDYVSGIITNIVNDGDATIDGEITPFASVECNNAITVCKNDISDECVVVFTNPTDGSTISVNF